jgi:hypothetical protein
MPQDKKKLTVHAGTLVPDSQNLSCVTSSL